MYDAICGSPPVAGVGKTCLLLRYANDSFSPTFITTIGIDFKIKTVETDGKRIKLQASLKSACRASCQASHTSSCAHRYGTLRGKNGLGQSRRPTFVAHRCVRRSGCEGALAQQATLARVQGILLVYDVTDRNSFQVRWRRCVCARESLAPDDVSRPLPSHSRQSIKTWVDEIDRNADKHVNKILIGNKCDVDESMRVRATGWACACIPSLRLPHLLALTARRPFPGRKARLSRGTTACRSSRPLPRRT